MRHACIKAWNYHEKCHISPYFSQKVQDADRLPEYQTSLLGVFTQSNKIHCKLPNEKNIQGEMVTGLWRVATRTELH